MVELQSVGHLHLTHAVRGSLHHRHQLGRRLDTTTEIVEVRHQSPQVDLHDSLVRLALQHLGYVFETELASTL